MKKPPSICTERSQLPVFFRYIAVGATLNLIAIGLVLGLHRLGLQYDLAFLITVVVLFFASFYLQRRVVFQDKGNAWRALLAYGALYASSYFLQIALYRLLFEFTPFPEQISIVLTVAIAALYSFLVLRMFVFSQKPPA